MWIVENDGQVFQGKRIWLRPGKKFLFGRTSTDAGGFVIANKTISRKHLIVEVGEVQPGDGMRPHVRSKITLEDLQTKIGTTVNGEQIRGQTKVLENNRDVFEVKLGNYEDIFRFTWTPVVLTFSFTGKELRSNPLDVICQNLESLDIKVEVAYTRATTHVVARKRNTSKGLQALINGKYIVDHPFVDAIMEAAGWNDDTKTYLSIDQVSNLEDDYNGNWPNPLDFLPPRGQEPTQRSSDTYSPRPERQDIFEGYTFIFYEQAQFDNLLAPITDGRGKALLRQADPELTTVDQFVGYVKSVAGEKGLGELEDGSEAKGVIVVRYIPVKGSTRAFYESFMQDVSLRLDHRMIEQSEFLDAILNNDASSLRKRLELEPDSTAPPSTYATMKPPISTAALNVGPEYSDIAKGEPPGSVPVPSAPEPAAPKRMGRSRRAITSRFKGFDDTFDTNATTPSLDPTQNTPAQDEPVRGLFISQSEEMDASNEVPTEEGRLTRKRGLSIQIEDSDEDVMEHLAPAAAMLKKRRLAEDDARRLRGESVPEPAPANVTGRRGAAVTAVKEEPLAKRKRKKEPEMDVIEQARIQREKAEELARQEREALHAAMDGMDIADIRNLAQIEEMDVVRLVPRPRRHTHNLRDGGGDDDGPRSDEEGGAEERWDEKWNGRKNFKRFRKRGDTAARRLDRVIVPLEEMKKRDFGIGDEYWIGGSTSEMPDSNTSQRVRKGKGKGKARAEVGLDDTQEATAFGSVHGRSRGVEAGGRATRKDARAIGRGGNEPITIPDDDDEVVGEAFDETSDKILPPGRHRSDSPDEELPEMTDVAAVHEAEKAAAKRPGRAAPLSRSQAVNPTPSQRNTRASVDRDTRSGQSQSQRAITTSMKRAAAEPLSNPGAAKKGKSSSSIPAASSSMRSSRATRAPVQTQDDDSDEEVGFRFKKR